ncbi:RNA-binding protein NOB1 [Chironomus tepperi]|uniref:RNA-binding protein NOB1 n=1 Tax=Chironomus tepperi TaxID=113505 RepID=UPI00391F839E
MSKKVKNLVVDTTAFIDNAQLQELAENIYTIQEVVDEVKNSKQLKNLVLLPYNLEIKQPDPEAVKIVTEFSKKTGDFATLSATDIKVVALTYDLEKQLVGTNHLRKEPIAAQTHYTAKPTEESKNRNQLPGFYNPKDGEDEWDEIEEDFDEEEEEDMAENNTEDGQEEEINEQLIEKLCTMDISPSNEESGDVLQAVTDEAEDSKQMELDQEEESSDNESNTSDNDDESWITPSNIKNVKKNFSSDVLEEKEVEVGCITTDFAMQNVLKQMNLNVTALDGRIIKYVRTFILRCYTCFKTTTDSTKVFCPKCGNKTLKRVSVSVNEKGEKVIHLNPRKQITTKFKNQTISKPKGGKHAVNPLLFADQLIPQQRVSKKALQKTDALDDNYTAGYSPFVIRDLDSRSSKLRGTTNIKQWMQNYEYDNNRRGYKKNKK